MLYLCLHVSHSNVTFQLLFPSETNRINGLDEGVEFSVQFGSERGWIPITLTILSGRNGRINDIDIGTDYTEGNVLIRGYLPELKVASHGDNTLHRVTVCDFEDSAYFVQFRWLQTSKLNTDKTVKDPWTLDSVLITFQDEEYETYLIFDGSK